MRLDEDQRDKVWAIECNEVDSINEPTLRGGICVSRKGFILTSSLGITGDNLQGRFYNSTEWFKLKIVNQKPNFGVALLRVLERNQDFSFFDLSEGVYLARKEPLFGVLHRGHTPFTTVFGNSCRPFNSDRINIPSLESEDTVGENGIDRQAILESHFRCLYSRNIVDVDSDDEVPDLRDDKHPALSVGDDEDLRFRVRDDVDDELVEIGAGVGVGVGDDIRDDEYPDFKDDEDRVLGYGVGDDEDFGYGVGDDEDFGYGVGDDEDFGFGVGDDEYNELVEVGDGDGAGVGDGNGDGDGDGDGDDEYDELDADLAQKLDADLAQKLDDCELDDELDDALEDALAQKLDEVQAIDLNFLHPDIPLIQVYGLAYGIGSIGCPIFNEEGVILGLYLFDKGGYEYIIPKSFLSTFVSQSLASRKERRASKKRRRQQSRSVSTKRQKHDRESKTSSAATSSNQSKQKAPGLSDCLDSALMQIC